MTSTTIAINTTFAHISDDRSMKIKATDQGQEKEAVVDITIGSAVTYTSGGLTMDFTQVRGFKAVYFCQIIHNGYVLPVVFVPTATTYAAATGKLKFYDDTGTELSGGSSAVQNAAIRVVIRGY